MQQRPRFVIISKHLSSSLSILEIICPITQEAKDHIQQIRMLIFSNNLIITYYKDAYL